MHMAQVSVKNSWGRIRGDSHSLAFVTGPMSKLNRTIVTKIYQEDIQKFYEIST